MKSFLDVLLVSGAMIHAIYASEARELRNNSILPYSKLTTTVKPTTITSMPSLPSTTAATNASMCSEDLGFSLYSGYTDVSLRCFCASEFMSWFTTSNPPTRTITDLRPGGITTETITAASSTITTVVEATLTDVATVVGNFGGKDQFDWPGTAVSPCCSSCVIAAETVNIFYWPTPAIPSQATEFVNPDGYTFKSPTAYLGFTSLYASDYCANVGKVYISTTFEFGPSELSTFGSPIVTLLTTAVPSQGPDGTTTLVTTVETVSNRGLASVLNYRDLGQNCSTISGYSYVPGNPLATIDLGDPCHPTIVLPEKVKSADPAWASCINNPIGGFYDPPFALTSVAGELQPFSSSSALPAQTPQSDQAPSTSVQTISHIVTAPPTSPLAPATSNATPPVETSKTQQSALPPSSEQPPADSTNSRATSIGLIATPGNPPASNSSPVQPASSPAQDPSLPPHSLSDLPIIGSQTLSPGGPPITVSGTVLSLVPSGSGVIVNGESIVPLTAILPPSQTLVTIGSQTIVAGEPPITVSGTVLSLQSGGAVVINGESTIPAAAISILISAPAVLSTEALTPGGFPVVTDGTTFSLETTGSNVIENGASTIPASSANAIISSASEAAIASAIASMMGLSATTVTTSSGSASSTLESSSSGSTASELSIAPSSLVSGTSGTPNPTKTGSGVQVQVEAIWITLLGVLMLFL